jgi:hypothetical protein
MAGLRKFDTPTRRWRLKVAVVGFAILQAGQLLAGPYRVWPFCAYDMFAFRANSSSTALVIELVDDAGYRVSVPPGKVVPLEFFRATTLFDRTFVRDTDDTRKQRLAARILRSLEEAPWSGFDEVWSSERPRPGRRFVGLRVVRLEQSVTLSPAGAALTVQGKHLLYEYTRPPSGTSS